MKALIKTMMAGIAACAFAAPAFAYTINGTIPGNSPLIAIHLQQPPSPKGFLKLTFSSPPVNAGVPYTVNFCVNFASAPHPCSSTTLAAASLIVPGQQAIVFVPASLYPKEVVWIGQGTNVAVPYSLDVDYIP
jgi:hypothetical protein